MHLVEVGGERILLDCGLSRADPGQARARRTVFPFPPASIDAVVLSHAHVDHCGKLPYLVEQGFTGPIYCTPPTLELIAVMLSDSARIQEEEGHVQSLIGGAEAFPRSTLTARQNVQHTLQQCLPVEYGQTVAISPAVDLTLFDAGHILGSAMVRLRLAAYPREVTLTFTGDLGRRGLPYLRNAAAIPPADLLLCESTYGGRLHQAVERMEETFIQVVERSLDEGGTILVPAFSLGRTQLVVHYLQEWMLSGRMPLVPIFVDSPLAADIAEVYDRYPAHFAPSKHWDASSANHPRPVVEYVRSRSQSDHLLDRTDPCIIVASGGMCDGGRIIKHLRRHVDDPRASLVLVSYQAPGTLGRQFLEQRPTVRFHGRTWNKWIHVVELNGFSGHADHNDFLAYLKPLAGSTGKVRLVHGELTAAEHLAGSLRDLGFSDVAIPGREESETIP